MHLSKKTLFVVLAILICCVPAFAEADVFDSAMAMVLAPSNLLLATGGLLTLIGILRPFKRDSQEDE